MPEHTVAAKALAYGLGADLIEQDLVATKDRELVVLHDIMLDDVSDVATLLPQRCRHDGRFYVVDFTLSELESLSLHERRQPGRPGALYPSRFPFALKAFKVVRFADEIKLIAGLNVSTGRQVGIYPEIKDPAWHRRAGIDLPGLLLEALERARALVTGPVFVQCFESQTLIRIHETRGAQWPLVQLIDDAGALRLARDRRALERIAGYAVGVGVPYTALLERSADGALARATPLARDIAAAGLSIHAYTLRRDAAPLGAVLYATALRALIHDLEVDAIFCDFPDDAVRIRDCSAA